MYFSESCGRQYKNNKNFVDLCPHLHDFGITAEWISATCEGNGGAVKQHISKGNPQRSLNN